MEKRGRARSEQARAAVLLATRELVQEQGYAHLTIEKIAARAHVGKPTIYRWWQSKSAILAECILAGDVIPQAVIDSSAETIRVSASDWFREVLAYVDNNAPLLRGLVAAAYEDAAVAKQLMADLGRPLEIALEEWAAAARAAGREQPVMSAGALTQLLFGAILYRLAALDVRGVESGEELSDILIDQFLRPGEPSGRL
jgi:AcrR family transcriptional regulator